MYFDTILSTSVIDFNLELNHDVDSLCVSSSY